MRIADRWVLTLRQNKSYRNWINGTVRYLCGFHGYFLRLNMAPYLRHPFPEPTNARHHFTGSWFPVSALVLFLRLAVYASLNLVPYSAPCYYREALVNSCHKLARNGVRRIKMNAPRNISGPMYSYAVNPSMKSSFIASDGNLSKLIYATFPLGNWLRLICGIPLYRPIAYGSFLVFGGRRSISRGHFSSAMDRIYDKPFSAESNRCVFVALLIKTVVISEFQGTFSPTTPYSRIGR